MRQVILDTETTGLEPKQGHRIIEIGCVEIINRRKTDRMFHQYLNPQREIEDGAFDIHGLSNEFLVDKPLFADVAQELIDFIRDSEVIIHNAPFDLAFIDAELNRLGKQWGKTENYCQVLDTLPMARELHPGQKNSLDALCSRYEVDNSQRELHGALLDARILLDVYLAMTRSQASLLLDDEDNKDSDDVETRFRFTSDRAALKVIEPDEEELLAHAQRLKHIEKESGGNCLWLKTEK
ncbi:MAG: DNA polymerase III subunit epsilon [Gammaproteobacteria bacterium]|jgi:DNA polymerase III subunit epsilon|nr:DNA polymerase III subunit epsilon [Gammaproteobacteria bacterium]